MIKSKKIIIILTVVLCLVSQKSFAQNDSLQIIADKNELIVGEEGSLTIKLPNTNIASFTLEIYYNHDNLDYVSGPENSNEIENRIIYTWTDSQAKGKSNIEVKPFTFRALAGSWAQINVIGEFYDKDGNEVKIEPQNFTWHISEEVQTQNVKGNFDKSSANLDILRLSHEGISPQFETNVTEYYITLDTSVETLDVEAIPENPNAKVEISGSGKMILGKNTITIKVTSEDGTQSKTYIIYVTKTDNIEKANANLETLAIRQGTLNPEFSDSQFTEYRVEIDNNIENIDLLAIPQNQNAKVEIKKDDVMKIGDNKIYINVTAEDGITNKKYQVTVHRRTEEEQKQYEKEQEEQRIIAERLLATVNNDTNNISGKNIELNQQNAVDEVIEETEKKERNNGIIIIAFILVGLIIFVIIKNRDKIRKKT